jgi:hypothetical protein
MNIEYLTPPHRTYSKDTTHFISHVTKLIPIESVAFLIGAVAVRVFSTALTAPFLGIGLSILVTRLVIKLIDCYDDTLLVNLTKEVCKFNKRYPKLQIITFIATLALCFLSKTLSFILGISLGSFGSIILDVENYKLLQQANRKYLSVV